MPDSLCTQVMKSTPSGYSLATDQPGADDRCAYSLWKGVMDVPRLNC